MKMYKLMLVIDRAYIAVLCSHAQGVQIIEDYLNNCHMANYILNYPNLMFVARASSISYMQLIENVPTQLEKTQKAQEKYFEALRKRASDGESWKGNSDE